MVFIVLFAFGLGLTALYHRNHKHDFRYQGWGPTLFFGSLGSLFISAVVCFAFSGIFVRDVHTETQQMVPLEGSTYVTTREVRQEDVNVWQVKTNGESKIVFNDSSHVKIFVSDTKPYVKSYAYRGSSYIWPGSDGITWYEKSELFLPENAVSVENRIKTAFN